MRAAAIHRQKGFSLVEVLIVLVIVAIIMTAVLMVFDSSSHINKTETQTSDVQQALRVALDEIARNVRMAGVGDLPITQAVVAVDPIGATSYDNVSSYSIRDDSNTAHPVRNGTDVLEVRGVFTTPIFALTGNGCGTCNTAGATITIPNTTGYGVTNNASSQFTTLQSGLATAGEHLFVVSSVQPTDTTNYGGSHYNVGFVTGSDFSNPATSVTVTADFTDARATDFDSNVTYAATAPTPTTLESNLRGGMLDDLIFFIDNTNSSHPTLTEGQMVKVTGNREFKMTPIADDVEDFQVAYGIDVDGDGSVGSQVAAAADDDEWVGNYNADTAVGADASHQFYSASGSSRPALRAVMISLLGRGNQPDPTVAGRFLATPPSIFNHIIVVSSLSTADKQYSRRLLTARLDLRNYQ